VKIAIDARALLPPTTGIGTYTRGIAGALAARPGIEVRLFSPRPLPGGDGAIGLDVCAETRALGMLWVQATLSRRAREWGADAILAALTIGPVRGTVPLVSVVHDLTAWTHPEWHKSRTVVGFVPLWESTVERASRFLCVSKATARELATAYPEAASRIRVAPNGVDAFFTPGRPGSPELEETRRRFAGGRRYILSLSTLEPRKNLSILVDACDLLWRRRPEAPDLLLAGGAGWKTERLYERIAASLFRDRIHLTGYASSAMALDLYRAAEIFVYPSLSEGFGLPVVEAMACGAPVIASTAEALAEVAGDAALFADPRDAAGFARQIERLLDDSVLAGRLSDAGIARAATFSWGAAAEKTAGVLEEAAREAR
jgi:glycosyltransferase involved in cell wall biosynthesis